ncbi:AAA family ATPase [Pseudobdellovibrio exovorus]|uniref:ATPase AAA-type core domain-containing protein n=1 Tax=Pseudobdellovibrio exovorus JSS TaxID=1184267 RepID=M4VQF1_9BACT|nr:AAA family ATPase [Pseudobdellovibrio exovorus]AGH95384.1 hypothetical protein A11Q_1168 [Pseudobdellovibrio exovorus JSS]
MNKNMKKLPRWGDYYLSYSHKLGTEILGNQEATDAVAAILASHAERHKVKNPPLAPRVLIVAPPSSGKSYLVEQAAKLLQMPTAFANAAILSGPGYKGTDITVALKALIADAGLGGIRRAESSSIIALDEIDKIVRRKDKEYSELIQYSLLPILSAEKIVIEALVYDETNEQFSTFNSLVFAMGVFPSTQKRDWKDPETSRRTLVKVGFCEEFAGRFTHFIYLNQLRKEQIKDLVLREETSIARLYQTGAKTPNLDPSEVNTVVNKAISSRFGFRSTRSQLHQILTNKANNTICRF